MSPPASELYQEIILDHNRAPRNYYAMEAADQRIEGYNPLCGDQLTIWVRMDGDRIGEVSFQGSGCAISKASASLMTQAVKGKTRAEAEALIRGFHQMLTTSAGSGEALPNRLAAFAGVREFPVRVKCATLSWHALRAALSGSAERTVSSE